MQLLHGSLGGAAAPPWLAPTIGKEVPKIDGEDEVMAEAMATEKVASKALGDSGDGGRLAVAAAAAPLLLPTALAVLAGAAAADVAVLRAAIGAAVAPLGGTPTGVVLRRWLDAVAAATVTVNIVGLGLDPLSGGDADARALVGVVPGAAAGAYGGSGVDVRLHTARWRFGVAALAHAAAAVTTGVAMIGSPMAISAAMAEEGSHVRGERWGEEWGEALSLADALLPTLHPLLVAAVKLLETYRAVAPLAMAQARGGRGREDDVDAMDTRGDDDDDGDDIGGGSRGASEGGLRDAVDG
ncbi:hypothetical protein MMPV_010142 [Pyropia vietnamensis]